MPYAVTRTLSILLTGAGLAGVFGTQAAAQQAADALSSGLALQAGKCGPVRGDVSLAAARRDFDALARMFTDSTQCLRGLSRGQPEAMARRLLDLADDHAVLAANAREHDIAAFRVILAPVGMK